MRFKGTTKLYVAIIGILTKLPFWYLKQKKPQKLPQPHVILQSVLPFFTGSLLRLFRSQWALEKAPGAESCARSAELLLGAKDCWERNIKIVCLWQSLIGMVWRHGSLLWRVALQRLPQPGGICVLLFGCYCLTVVRKEQWEMLSSHLSQEGFDEFKPCQKMPNFIPG